MNKYGEKAKKKIEKTIHEFGKGELKTHGRRVTNRKQAVAIGISEARRTGGKVPPENNKR